MNKENDVTSVSKDSNSIGDAPLESGNSVEQNEKTYERSLVKIREGDMTFVAAIFSFSQDWLDEEYPDGNAKGFVRNAKDGTYELFAVITEID